MAFLKHDERFHVGHLSEEGWGIERLLVSGFFQREKAIYCKENFTSVGS